MQNKTAWNVNMAISSKYIERIVQEIPVFDGENVNVSKFVSSVEDVANRVNYKLQFSFLDAVMMKLVGSAKKRIGDKEFKSVGHFIEFIEISYVPPWDHKYYYSKIDKFCMKPYESVAAYTKKFKIFIEHLSIALEQSFVGTSLIKKKIDLAAKALTIYLNGLREDLKNSVIYESPEDINEAAAMATNEENRYGGSKFAMDSLYLKPRRNFNKNNRVNKVMEYLLPQSFNKSQTHALFEIVYKFHDVFFLPGDRLGSIKVYEHNIETTDDKPVKISQYNRTFNNVTLNNEIQKLIEKKFIVPSVSEYNSPVILKPKKNDPSQHRVVVDYRALNTKIPVFDYRIPRIEDNLHIFKGAKYFSTFDLVDATYQIKINPKDRKKTAFTTSLGHFEFVRFPTGLKNGSPTMQKLMDKVLQGLQGIECFVYIDDIIIPATSLSHLLTKCKMLFTKLKSAGIFISTEKCEFYKQSVIYLGCAVTDEGLKPDPEKVNRILDFFMPNNFLDLKDFLNLICCLQSFIPDYSERAKCLHDLWKSYKDNNKANYTWTEAHEYSFLNLKGFIRAKPVLHYPSLQECFLIKLRTFNETISADLYQLIDSQEKVIKCLSRELKTNELIFIPELKECIGLSYALARFENYIKGRTFLVKMNENSFSYLNEIKNPTSKSLSLKALFSQHTFKVMHDETANKATCNTETALTGNAKFDKEELEVNAKEPEKCMENLNSLMDCQQQSEEKSSESPEQDNFSDKTSDSGCVLSEGSSDLTDRKSSLEIMDENINNKAVNEVVPKNSKCDSINDGTIESRCILTVADCKEDNLITCVPPIKENINSSKSENLSHTDNVDCTLL